MYAGGECVGLKVGAGARAALGACAGAAAVAAGRGSLAAPGAGCALEVVPAGAGCGELVMQQSRTGARRGASAPLRAFLQQACRRFKGQALARAPRGAAIPAAAVAQTSATAKSSLANTSL
jgi:hypothetical protein